MQNDVDMEHQGTQDLLDKMQRQLDGSLQYFYEKIVNVEATFVCLGSLEAQVSKMVGLEKSGRQMVTALWKECEGTKELVASVRTTGSEMMTEMLAQIDDMARKMTTSIVDEAVGMRLQLKGTASVKNEGSASWGWNKSVKSAETSARELVTVGAFIARWNGMEWI